MARAARLGGHRRSGPSGRPPFDFVVVGAQKAGSTHLATALSRHPELFVSGDEVPFFEDPFYEHSSATELERACGRAGPRQLRGIHRPEYLARPECAQRLAADVAGLRVLAVLRDPAARAISAYYWYVQFGLLPVVPLDVGMARLLDGWTDARYPHAADVIDFGFYGRQLRRYLDAVGEARVLVLRAEDLRLPATFARVFRFLGVEESFVPRSIDRLTNAGVYDQRRLQFLRLRRHTAFHWEGRTVYRHRARRLRQPVRSAASAAIVGVDRVLLARLFGNRNPEVPPALLARLRSTYASDVALVEQALGWDLAAWRCH